MSLGVAIMNVSLGFAIVLGHNLYGQLWSAEHSRRRRSTASTASTHAHCTHQVQSASNSASTACTHQVQPSTIGSLGLEPPLRGLAVLRKSLDTRRMPFEKKGKEIGVICLL